MITKFTPIGNRVVIRPVPPPDKTPGGIFIPEEARIPTRQAKIVSVGDKVTDLKPGDEVMLPEHRGTPVTIKGETLHIMSPLDLLAIITHRPK